MFLVLFCQEWDNGISWYWFPQPFEGPGAVGALRWSPLTAAFYHTDAIVFYVQHNNRKVGKQLLEIRGFANYCSSFYTKWTQKDSVWAVRRRKENKNVMASLRAYAFLPFPGWTGSQESKDEGDLDWQPVQVIRTFLSAQTRSRHLDKEEKELFLDSTALWSPFSPSGRLSITSHWFFLLSVRALNPCDLLSRDGFSKSFCI